MSTVAYIVVGGCDYYVMFGVKSSFCQKQYAGSTNYKNPLQSLVYGGISWYSMPCSKIAMADEKNTFYVESLAFINVLQHTYCRKATDVPSYNISYFSTPPTRSSTSPPMISSVLVAHDTTENRSEAPFSRIIFKNTNSAIGERQILPQQMNRIRFFVFLEKLTYAVMIFQKGLPQTRKPLLVFRVGFYDGVVL